MGCFTFLSTETVTVFSILLLVTTPILVLRKFRSEEHTSELQSQSNLVCRLLLEKKKKRYSVSHDASNGDLGLENIGGCTCERACDSKIALRRNGYSYNIGSSRDPVGQKV